MEGPRLKLLLISGIIASFLPGCSTPQQQASRKADSSLLTDTMPMLRPEPKADKMPVIPMDTAKSDMPVVQPPDSIQSK